MGCSQDVIFQRPEGVTRGRPQDISRRCPLALHIGNYREVFRTLHWGVLRMSYFNVLRPFVKNILRTLAGNIPWRYTQNHISASIGRLLETSSGRNFTEWDAAFTYGYILVCNDDK